MSAKRAATAASGRTSEGLVWAAFHGTTLIVSAHSEAGSSSLRGAKNVPALTSIVLESTKFPMS